MPAIYSLDYNVLFEQILPPTKRKAVFKALGACFMRPMQWLHDLLFTTYADGFSGSIWNSVSTYAAGDRVRHTDHKVYEAKIAVIANQDPSTQTTYWMPIQDNWIGLRERIKYNGQKMVLEYALNKWFDTQFRYLPSVSDIYITNNTIFVNQFKISIAEASTTSFVPVSGMFGVDGIPLVGVSLNQNAFTIYVPLAVYNALSTVPASREQIIRAFADQYVIAGIQYNITTY